MRRGDNEEERAANEIKESWRANFGIVERVLSVYSQTGGFRDSRNLYARVRRSQDESEKNFKK